MEFWEFFWYFMNWKLLEYEIFNNHQMQNAKLQRNRKSTHVELLSIVFILINFCTLSELGKLEQTAAIYYFLFTCFNFYV